MTLQLRKFFPLLGLTVLALAPLLNAPAVSAGNTAITGGTNGPACNSGGYFTPSSVTVTSGDTVTISVPSNDPYAGGIQVHGFPEGLFTIVPGNSHTTTALTANVSYYGTWPSTGCMKGSGSITVTAAPTPTPPPATHTPTPAAAPAKTATPSPVSSASPSPIATAAPTPAVNPGGPNVAASPAPAATPSAKPMSAVLAASAGGGGLIVLIVGGFLVWRFVIKPRLKPPPPPPASPPSVPPSVPTPPIT